MHLLKFLLISLLLSLWINLNAQTDKILHCGTKEYMNDLIKQNPEIIQSINNIETETENWISNNKQKGILNVDPITIPVIFHILQSPSSPFIPDSTVFKQIAILNRDYGKLNADTIKIPYQFKSLAIDTKIRFQLASVDPSGKTTTGIDRKTTSFKSFSQTNNEMKFASAGGIGIWNRNAYLNIWICNITQIMKGYTLLGYTQMPGGPANSDGVVLHELAFTSKLYNRTIVHEVGHWFNLKHPWGDVDSVCYGDDIVEDTPLQIGPIYNHPHFPYYSCDNTIAMTMNYMEYTDDSCKYMFSTGQAHRMLATLNNFRSGFKTGTKIAPVARTIVYPIPSTGIVNIDLFGLISDPIYFDLYSTSGLQVYSALIPAPNSSNIQIDLSGIGRGLYFAHIRINEDVYMVKILLMNNKE